MFICQGPGTEVFFTVNCELNKYEFSRGTKDLLCLKTFPFPRMQSTLYMHLCITLLLLTLIKVYIYFYSTHSHAEELRRGGGQEVHVSIYIHSHGEAIKGIFSSHLI